MLSSEIHSLRKLSIIGHPAVGKTTILKLLSQNTIDRIYLPTHGLDLKTVKIGDFTIRVWDFGGQSSYLKNYSGDHMLGSDLILVITDSSPKNVLRSQELIGYATHFVDKSCPIIAIANKQDLNKTNGRMTPERVEEILNVKTFGLSAINPAERERLEQIIRKELNKTAIRRRFKEIEL